MFDLSLQIPALLMHVSALVKEGKRENMRTFSKLQATVKAWLPNRKSQAIATHSLPTMAMQEPYWR